VGFSLENVPGILRKSKSLKEFLRKTFIKFPTFKTFNSKPPEKLEKNVPSFN
jgi:hypothetical protein